MPPLVTPSSFRWRSHSSSSDRSGTREGQMIQARAALVERLCALQIGELVNTDERPSHEPHDVMEGTGVFVDDRIGAEQLLVPGPAAAEVADGQRHVCDRRKLRHEGLRS